AWDRTFEPGDFDDLRERFPHEARTEESIDAEPAAAFPPDWESRLEGSQWAQQLWQGTAQVDGDTSPSGYSYHFAVWLERHTPYTDGEKLAILAAHYPQGMGDQRPAGELARKARLSLTAARGRVEALAARAPARRHIRRMARSVAQYPAGRRTGRVE